MENNLDERQRIREYLLGILDDPAIMNQIESRLLDDDNFAGELDLAEDLLVEQYIDGELSPAEAAGFETHFLATPERQQHLRINQDLRSIAIAGMAGQVAEPVIAPETAGWRKLFALPAFSYALVAVVVLGLGYGVWRIAFSNRGNIDAQLAELAEAYKGTRPFEARIIGFGYAAKSDTRGPSKNPTADERLAETRRDQVKGKLAEAAEKEPAAETQYGLGKAYLAEGDLDQALFLFEQAEANSTGNARLKSDLGTLYLELGRKAGEKDKAGLLDKALRNFERAIQIDPRLLEPRFNRALCLELQNIPEQAKQAWRDYLAIDPDSPWAEEARTHLKRLEEKAILLKSSGQVLQDFFLAFDANDDQRAWRIVSQTKEPNTGVMVMQQLARGAIGADVVDPPGDPARYLAAMHYVGELETARSGDPYFAEIAQHYTTAGQAQRNDLQQAHIMAAEGFALYQDRKCQQALGKFTGSAALFTSGASPGESGLMEVWAAICSSRTGDIAAINASLIKLNATCTDRGWKWLGSVINSLIAINHFGQNEISDSLKYNDLAIATSSEIGDTFNLHRVLSTQAYIYRLLQNYDEALKLFGRIHPDEALYYASPRQTWRNYYVYSEILSGMKGYTSAIAAGREAIDISANIRAPAIAADSQKLLAILYSGAEKFPQALSTIEKTIAEVQENEPEGERGVESHLFLMQRAHFQRRSGDCRSAVVSYKDVINVYKHPKLVSVTANLYEAHKGLLQCYVTLGMRSDIESELAETLRLAETNREKITAEKNRSTFFDSEQDLYDLAIEYTMSTGNSARAFEYSEQSRARSLLNSMAKSTGEIPPRLRNTEEIRNDIPENIQILQYAVLPSEVVAWVVSKEGISSVRTRISEGELRQKIRTYRDLLLNDKTGNSAERENAAKELYDLVIKPTAGLLKSDKIICLVPDKDLNYLSVRSLIAPETGRYVLEDYTLLSAPSTAVFLLSSEAAREKGRSGDETFTAVGNPGFDRSKYPNLEDLPDAGREVNTIEKFYTSPLTFFDKTAEKQPILSAFSRGGIFHFAGHYVVDEISPDRSRMLLADNGGDPAASGLEVGEIPVQNLSATKLTVLSACSTAVEGYFNGEGMFGAARAFLARGVPLVVASQWNVESAPTADMMIGFHRYRREQKLSSVAALRKAQLDMLHAPDPKYRSPVFWAGFIAIGGNAEY